MIQTETERQFYLGMAGVSLWYARDALPGAAPSPEFVFPDEGVVPIPEPVPAASESRPRSAEKSAGPAAARIPDLQALMGEASDKPAIEPQKKASQEAENPEIAQGTVPDPAEDDAAPAELPVRLNLKVWAGKGVCLVCGMTDDSSVRLQETLALNILKSIGQVSPEAVGPIRWPLFNNLKVAGNSAADLRRVLSRTLSQFKGRTTISLLSADQDGDSERLLAMLQESGLGADLSFGHSLAELAANPDLKRQLWRRLQTLERG